MPLYLRKMDRAAKRAMPDESRSCACGNGFQCRPGSTRIYCNPACKSLYNGRKFRKDNPTYYHGTYIYRGPRKNKRPPQLKEKRQCIVCGGGFYAFIGRTLHLCCSSKCRGTNCARKARKKNPERHRKALREKYWRDPAKACFEKKKSALRHPERTKARVRSDQAKMFAGARALVAHGLAEWPPALQGQGAAYLKRVRELYNAAKELELI